MMRPNADFGDTNTDRTYVGTGYDGPGVDTERVNGIQNGNTRRHDVCCSILYAAYYNERSPKNPTVLVSSLTASPAWLDMVRQLNKDVLCDSVAWTDFSLTTSAAYSATAIDGGAERRNRPNETSRKRENVSGHTSRHESRNKVSSPLRHRQESVSSTREDANDIIPERAKQILRRYFYDDMCQHLAAKYGVPTLLVFQDRLRRGLELNSDDYNHRWFVDAMLTDIRFVAAVQITRSTERANEQSGNADQHTAQQRISPASVERGNASADGGQRLDESNERRQRDVDEDSLSSNRNEMAFEFRDDDGYMFDDDLVALQSPPTRFLQSPGSITAMSDKEIDFMFDQYELERNDKKKKTTWQSNDTRTDVTKSNAVTRDALDKSSSTGENDSVARSFKRDGVASDQGARANVGHSMNDCSRTAELNIAAAMMEYEVGDASTAIDPKDSIPSTERNSANAQSLTDKSIIGRNARKALKRPLKIEIVSKSNSNKRRRIFRELGNSETKENIDISDDDENGRNVSQTRSIGSDGRQRRRSFTRSTGGYGMTFAIQSVELVRDDVILPTAGQLISDAVLFVYRLERQSSNVLSCVRTIRIASTNSSVPIELDSVNVDCDELLYYLRKIFGSQTAWLGRRRSDAEMFRIRNLSVDAYFAEHVPRLSVLLVRSASTNTSFRV